MTPGAILALFVPPPKVKPAPLLVPTYAVPEPDYDPSAFWLYADWDSGPMTEPFWMRPLRTPEHFDNRPNFSGGWAIPVSYGVNRRF